MNQSEAQELKRQLLDLFSVLGGDPYNVNTQQQMAQLLRAEGEEKAPNRGLISHALRPGEPKVVTPSREFAQRVAELHGHVINAMGSAGLCEFIGRRLVIPPKYDPQRVLKFHGGSLEGVGDIVLLKSSGDLPPRGAIVWVDAKRVRNCRICDRPFLWRTWNHVTCDDVGCKRKARANARAARRRRKRGEGKEGKGCSGS